MLDLDAWLDANSPTEGAKWTLTVARGLSDNGWITGYGSYDPDGPGRVSAATHAYLLDVNAPVPEPATLSVLLIGGNLPPPPSSALGKDKRL